MAPDAPPPDGPAETTAAFRTAAKAGAITVLVAAVGTMVTGDILGKLMTKYQPMKMAAAEALYHTPRPRRSRCSPSAR